jgi:hypothetical protein
MKEDIAIIRTALTAAKKVASAHRRGGLHKLWPQLVDGLKALKRIEAHLLPHQPSLMLTATDTTKSYTHTRPEPDTTPPSSRPSSPTHTPDTADYKRHV